MFPPLHSIGISTTSRQWGGRPNEVGVPLNTKERRWTQVSHRPICHKKA
ncbi:TPA: hypothetical protein ACNH0R_002430 [Acinetobacter baumannii]